MRLHPSAFFCILFLLVAIATAAAAAAAGRPFSSFDLDNNLRLPSGEQDLLYFREAPSFRNGGECVESLQLFDDLTQELCDPLSVHIAMTLDMAYLRGSLAAILSIVQHAACPENVAFHFLATHNKTKLAQMVRSIFPYLRFKVYHFDGNLVHDRISSSIREALQQPLNYARTYIPDVVPACVHRIIYLDSDVIVVDDISKLWSTDLQWHALAAPEYCHANFSQYFTEAFWLDESLRSVFDARNPCYFNTGVMVMDLDKWRNMGYSRTIELWMELQKERRIYELGSLPPFLLVFAGRVKPVDHRWNQHGLGGDNFEGKCRPLHPGPVSLLHWSGKGKPWIRLDAHKPCPLDNLWAPYDLFLPLHVDAK